MTSGEAAELYTRLLANRPSRACTILPETFVGDKGISPNLYVVSALLSNETPRSTLCLNGSSREVEAFLVEGTYENS
jgi:hypothetical protein